MSTLGNVGIAASVIGGTAVVGAIGGAVMGKYFPADRDTGSYDDGLRGVEVENTLIISGLAFGAGGIMSGFFHGQSAGWGVKNLGAGLAGGLAIGAGALTAGLAYESLT